jgi:carboxypeptidase Q
MIGDTYMGIIDAKIVNDEGEAVDTGPLRENGVPTMANVVKDTPSHDFYFQYHHSAGDSMTMMNP